MRKSFQAFTILELLTAVAVMALMLVLFLQITNHTLQTSKATTHQMDSSQAARRILDALSSDIANAVLGTESTILTKEAGGAPSLAFLTSGRGPDTTSSARFLAVGYKLENHQLIRSYSAVGWTDVPATYPGGFLYVAKAVSDSPAFTTSLASGILQFSVLAILEDGTMVSLLTPPANAAAFIPENTSFEGQTVPNGWTALVPAKPPIPNPLTSSTARVRALLVAIASVDEESLGLLGATTLTFDQPSTGFLTTWNPVTEWEAELSTESQLPGPVRSAIRFTTKVIPLP